MTAHAPPAPEFSRPVDIESLSEAAETVLDIHADAEERANLARRFGLVRLDSLAATVSLERNAAGDVSLAGRLKAEVVQTCVVTLEPVRATIEARLTRIFSPAAESGVETRDEIFLAPEGDEPPEPLAGGYVDVGEVVAETLGLEIDPFPRSPGAVFTSAAAAPSEAGNNLEKSGPFAALAKLKERR
jgi:uncharacterized metal-binding protein YceD (DUF177 family)